MANWVKGKTKVLSMASAASTAYTVGDLIVYPASQDNTVIRATSTTIKLMGISLTAKPVTDTSTNPILVEVPVEAGCEFECAVTGTLVATDVGGYFDLSDHVTVDRAATLVDAVLCTGFISATLGRFMLPSFAGIHSETYP